MNLYLNFNFQTSDQIERPPTMASVQVQSPQPIIEEASNSEAVHANSNGIADEAANANVDDNDVFEDPTLPQKLVGRLAGVEAIFGHPQMKLSDAIDAGK